MDPSRLFYGGLFTPDFLREAIGKEPEWQNLGEEAVGTFAAEARRLIAPFARSAHENESQTETDLIWPVLAALGWTATLRQQNLSPLGRSQVPDGLLFLNDPAKERALGVAEGPKRYANGTALVESKRWRRPLDRGSGRRGEALAPSSQMLRYLRHAAELTDGRIRWGILTNGAEWRLYYQGAQSVADQFFGPFLGIDLAAALDLPSGTNDLLRPDAEERHHALRLFFLFFQRRSFAARDLQGRNLHERLLRQSRYFEQQIAGDLSRVVFERVFPQLAGAIAAKAPDADLEEVRDAALVLLYRLLFILYAEDRNLLPVDDDTYANVGLRQRVREPVRRGMERGEAFSENATGYYHALTDLCRVVDRGDAAFNLPPYNGGLFQEERAPLLARVELPDSAMAAAVDALSFAEQPSGQRRYVNYRGLSVQHLGTIYERLLEHELTRADDERIDVRPNTFARRTSGSYYTPDDLVRLVLAKAVEPLVQRRFAAFRKALDALPQGKTKGLAALDPAAAILQLKICDPAMGSGHFLVKLVDVLSDHVIAALAEADEVPCYRSPVANEVAKVRQTVLDNAETQGWSVDFALLDDRQVVRRMVLKRCVYGVDKNPMAVELAKVSLWLHTFTAGAPLSFLDHHLRCGDSLFGCWIDAAKAKAEQGSPMFIREPLDLAFAAADPMQRLEALADAEIAEAEQSAALFADVDGQTAPLAAFLSVLHAFDWLRPADEDANAVRLWLDGVFGDPVALAAGQASIAGRRAKAGPGQGAVAAAAKRFAALLADARALAARERFLHWQVAFPGVWSDWEDADRADDGGRGGGFDAVIGNPPWDRMKMQQVEWFAARRPAIAQAQRAADRRRMIRQLDDAGDPLGAEFRVAEHRAGAALSVVRTGEDYPLLGHGDINLYSLFVERAMALVKPDGVVGLLTPSGIGSDKTAADFFRSISTEGRLRALYDFENKKVFFPHVHASFKFSVFVAGRAPSNEPSHCAFYLQDVSELEQRGFPLNAEDFRAVNPNTGTAPVFRTRRDAEITTKIYRRMPVLVDRSAAQPKASWPLKYRRMFDMTNDSGLFRTRQALEEQEGAWPVGGNVFDSANGRWLPLYEGKMVQAFDHRAADVTVNLANPHRPAQAVAATGEQSSDPSYSPTPQYWVRVKADDARWAIGFKDVTAPTNVRSMIAAVVPSRAAGNTLPLLLLDSGQNKQSVTQRHSVLVANLNAVVFDYLARQKVQGQHLNWYIVEQLPVVPPSRYAKTRFGAKTAAEVIREAVLELTYTAHDMAPFAKDMGHVDGNGNVKPPFPWNADRRLRLRAKLDAVYFRLYGVSNRNDVAYIYSTFPIVQAKEEAAWGSYRSRALCLAWLNALAAGQPDAEVDG